MTKQETVAEVLEELRGYPEAWARRCADQIQAAHDREVQALRQQIGAVRTELIEAVAAMELRIEQAGERNP